MSEKDDDKQVGVKLLMEVDRKKESEREREREEKSVCI